MEKRRFDLIFDVMKCDFCSNFVVTGSDSDVLCMKAFCFRSFLEGKRKKSDEGMLWELLFLVLNLF